MTTSLKIASLVLLICFVASIKAAPQAAIAAASSSSQAPANTPPVIEPIIDWGKCPALAPSEQQRKQKIDIIKSCLEANPIEGDVMKLTAEVVEKHRIKLGECALKKEDWFNTDNTYKYDRAEDELKKKPVDAEIKNKILEHHKKCKQQALEKHSSVAQIIEQVQLYQYCMDFHVSQLCSIKVILPPQ